MRVTAGHTRVKSVSHGSVEDQLFELWFSIGSVLVEVRVKQSIDLGLSSLNNWFGFTGYIFGSGIIFQ